MSVAVPPLNQQLEGNVNDATPSTLISRFRLWSDWFLRGLTLATFLLGIAAAIVHLYLALNFQSRPFAGVIVNRHLEVQEVETFSDRDWNGYNAGMQSGDTIVGYPESQDIDSITFSTIVEFNEQNGDDPQQAFNDYVENFAAGEQIILFVDREGGAGRFGNDGICVPSGTPDVQRCRVTYEVTDFPAVDFLAHFGIGYAIGLLVLGIAAVILARRIALREARFLSATAAGIAVFNMGRFDLFTSQNEFLTAVWIFAGCMIGGGVISFATVFPDTLPIVKRIPALRFLPQLIGLILFVFSYSLYVDEADFALALPVFFIFTGTITMLTIMLWRRQYSSSPILREQASYILLGGFFVGFTLAVWILWSLANGVAPSWVVPIVQVSSFVFLFNATYAVLQHRLLETDRLVPAVMVYSLLSFALVIAYFGIVTGLSVFGVTQLESDSPVLIAATVLVVTLGFVPVRNYLRDRIDQVMFRRRRLYQTRIETLIRSLTNALNLNDVEKAIRDTLQETVVPNGIILFVRDSEAQVFRAHRGVGTARPLTDITFDYSSGLIRYLQFEASMLYVEKNKLLPPMVYGDRSRIAILNMPVFVRLKGQRQLSGFLALGTRRSNEAYTYEDLRFIENIADQAALALERSQIVADLERQLTVQNVLSQLSRALNFAIDFDTLLELISAQTQRVMDVDVFSIAIVDANAHEMYYAFYSQGVDRLEHMEGKRWRLGNDLLSEIAQKQIAIRADDYRYEVQRRDPNAEIENSNIKAWMGVPMTADRVQGSLGVLSVASVDPLVLYNEDHEQILSDIANIAASAIDKTRLFQATQARTEQLEALNEISSRLSYEIEDVNRLLQLVTESATEILKSEAGSLLLADEENGDLIFQIAVGPSGHELVGMRIPMEGNSLAAEAVKQSETLIVNDAAKDIRWHGEVVNDDDDDARGRPFRSRAILTTPLLTKGKAIGVLQVINKKDGSLFTGEDATLLTTFAAQAAVAIENARLFGQTDEQLNQRLNELNLMTEIDKSLNRTLEMERVAEITVDWSLQQTNASAAAIAVVKGESDEMTLVAARGYPEGSMFYQAIGKDFSSKQGIWGRVIQTKRPAFSRGLQADLAYIETLPEAKVQTIVPMMSANEVIGILMVESEDETTLDLINAQFLERLADSASAAITNAQLFKQLQRQQEERVSFVRFIAHELKNPMTSMKGYTDLLLKGIVGPINDQQSDFLQTIYNNVDRLQTLVTDLNEVTQLESGTFPLELGSFDFHQIYRESLKSVQQGFDRKRQIVASEIPDELPLIWCDQKRLIQVMVNFLTNGNKYTPAEGTITIRADVALNIWDKEGARRVLHVQVADTGIGISAEDLPKLFREQYFRTDNARATDEPGTGLGMVLTRGLILQHGGQVWVESELNVGTTFHFTIPLAEEVLPETT